jgi:hypothetical protein
MILLVTEGNGEWSNAYEACEKIPSNSALGI